ERGDFYHQFSVQGPSILAATQACTVGGGSLPVAPTPCPFNPLQFCGQCCALEQQVGVVPRQSVDLSGVGTPPFRLGRWGIDEAQRTSALGDSGCDQPRRDRRRNRALPYAWHETHRSGSVQATGGGAHRCQEGGGRSRGAARPSRATGATCRRSQTAGFDG